MDSVFEELNKLYESKEFKVVYRLANWPVGETATACINANSVADAKDSFLEYMLDLDNYDEDEKPLSEDDIEIIKISK